MIRVGSIVQWTGVEGIDTGVVLKIEVDPYAPDGKKYDVYWFVDKELLSGHICKYLKVLVP